MKMILHEECLNFKRLILNSKSSSFPLVVAFLVLLQPLRKQPSGAGATVNEAQFRPNNEAVDLHQTRQMEVLETQLGERG